MLDDFSFGDSDSEDKSKKSSEEPFERRESISSQNSFRDSEGGTTPRT